MHHPGQLSGIDQRNLPQKLPPDGIQTIIQQRLTRVLVADQELLQLTAVAGRALNMALIKQLNDGEIPHAWLTRCANEYISTSLSEIINRMT
ncbi:MAG: hypothetical protein GY943_03640 [Chloroflexi bacterium]|nr:hypothetical protein [Chloroflexota bacterium]